jgi:hypothetical protein
VSMARVILAGLIFLTLAPLASFADQVGSFGQFVSVMAVVFAVTFVLPHYFYRGEPLLPDRRKRP